MRPAVLFLAGCTFVTRAEYDERLDLDGDGSPWPEDCAPDDPAVYPGASEICGNEVDEDCDGRDLWPCEADTDADTDSDSDADADTDADGDADTDADTDVPTGDTGCPGPDGDGDGVPDACDGCPGEPTLTEPVSVPVDLDGDGFGLGAADTCAPPAVVPRAGDCDDATVFVRPTTPEVPGNTVDEDCDGSLACFSDADGDGLGDIDAPVVPAGDGDCADAGEASVATDCDDADAGIGAGVCADQPPVAVLSIFPTVVEAGATVSFSAAFTTDAEDPAGTPEFRFDFDADGTFDTAFATTTDAATTYGTAGVLEPVVEVRDSAGNLAWASGLVVVAQPGTLLVVDTDADDNDAEPFGGPYTGGLSLREAVVLANDPGAAVVTFADRFVVAPATALPVVTGDDTTVAGVAGVVLDGAAAGGTGLEVDGDRGSLVGLHVRGFDTGLALGGTEAVVRGCEVEGNGTAFDFQLDGVRVQDSWVHDNTGVQVQVASEVTIERTRISGGTTGVRVDGSADRSVFRGVTVWGVAGDGLVLDTTAGGADDVEFTDGTIALCTGDGIDMANNADDLVLLNVVLASNGGAGVQDGSLANGSPDTVLWYDNAGGACGGCATGTNPTFADPQFVAPALGDLRVRRTSPAVDTGLSTGFDKNGAAPGTSSGAGPDIGAAER